MHSNRSTFRNKLTRKFISSGRNNLLFAMAVPTPGGHTQSFPQTRTGITSSDNDMEYCAELSRKAVARAALHLGIESISGDTLNVLGDVLLSYLERVGHALYN